MFDSDSSHTAAGLGTLAQRALGSLSEGLCTRVELGATELQEELLRLVYLGLAVVCTVVLAGNGLLALVLALAWMSGPAAGTGAGVLAGAALAFFAAAAGTAWWGWRLLREQRPLLADTLRVLRADVRALAGSRPSGDSG